MKAGAHLSSPLGCRVLDEMLCTNAPAPPCQAQSATDSVTSWVSGAAPLIMPLSAGGLCQQARQPQLPLGFIDPGLRQTPCFCSMRTP